MMKSDENWTAVCELVKTIIMSKKEEEERRRQNLASLRLLYDRLMAKYSRRLEVPTTCV